MDGLRKKAKGNAKDDDDGDGDGRDGCGGGSDDYERVFSSSTSAHRSSAVYPSCDVASLGKRCRSSKKTSSSSSSSASSNVRNEPETEEDDENELDTDEEWTSRNRKDFTPSRAEFKVTTIHHNSMNLSGPVTDL